MTATIIVTVTAATTVTVTVQDLLGKASSARPARQSLLGMAPFRQGFRGVLTKLTLRHLRYHVTGVTPQPNFPPDYVFRTDQPSRKTTLDPNLAVMQVSAQRNK